MAQQAQTEPPALQETPELDDKDLSEDDQETPELDDKRSQICPQTDLDVVAAFGVGAIRMTRRTRLTRRTMLHNLVKRGAPRRTATRKTGGGERGRKRSLMCPQRHLDVGTGGEVQECFSPSRPQVARGV